MHSWTTSGGCAADWLSCSRSFNPHLQACDGPCRFLQCVGLPANDTGKEHVQRLKAIMEATLDLYTFMVRFLLRSAPSAATEGTQIIRAPRTECRPAALHAFVSNLFLLHNLIWADSHRNRFLVWHVVSFYEILEKYFHYSGTSPLGLDFQSEISCFLISIVHGIGSSGRGVWPLPVLLKPFYCGKATIQYLNLLWH